MEKQHRQLEKQEKLEKERKKQEREKRIKKRKMQQADDDIEDEANSAIKMAKKNNKRKKEQERMSREQERINKKRKKKRRIIQTVILLVIIIGGGAFALTSPIFNIKDIEVLENNQISSDTIISLSGLKKDDNIFHFLKINIEQKIKQNAYIENVEIKRQLPGTVQIKVEERTKKFSVQFLNSYAIINNQGYILEISEENKGLPIIKGLKTSEEEMTASNRLKEEDLESLETCIKIMNTFKDNNLDEQVTSIEVTSENEYIVVMEEKQKTIYLGDKTNLSNKIIYVQAIIEDTKDAPGEIFVNGDLNNKFKPYFREKI